MVSGQKWRFWGYFYWTAFFVAFEEILNFPFHSHYHIDILHNIAIIKAITASVAIGVQFLKYSHLLWLHKSVFFSQDDHNKFIHNLQYVFKMSNGP